MFGFIWLTSDGSRIRVFLLLLLSSRPSQFRNIELDRQLRAFSVVQA